MSSFGGHTFLPVGRQAIGLLGVPKTKIGKDGIKEMVYVYIFIRDNCYDYCGSLGFSENKKHSIKRNDVLSKIKR